MSRERKRDNSTPSLFPFLAVLLCTMGALVLLLVLIVSRAQATAEQVVTEKKERVAEVESQLVSTQIELERQLADRRLDLEGKRLALQSLEKQIVELTDELKSLQRTAELLQQDTLSEAKPDETQRKISQLEQQLAEATDKLKNKLENPVGNKPIFAIIPYEGTNGTHRRPIYLECTDRGVIIQPEGVVIGPVDLQPPYGPGNPLDAALRAVRAKYAGANTSLTSSAYPLLVVRPSGVRTYAMARQAISSWDDQFGYELIDEKLELSYPEGEPGLANEIEQAIAAARQRQAALVMAMPRKYRQMINHPGDTEFVLNEGAAEDDGLWPGTGNGSGGPGGSAGGSDSLSGGNAAGATGARGGFAQANGLPGDPSGGNSGASSSYFAGGPGGGASGGQGSNSAYGFNNNSAAGGLGTTNGAGGAGTGNTGSALGADSGQPFGGGQGLGGSSRKSALGTGTGTGSGGSIAGGGLTAGNGGGDGFSGGSADGQGNGAAGSGFGESGQAGPGFASQGVGGNLAQGSAMQSFGQSQPSDLDGTLDPTQPMQMQKMVGAGSNSANRNSQSSTPDASRSGSNGGVASRGPMGTDRNSKAVPVAQSRGRNWAWSEGPPTKTAVLRSIRVVCYSDRWVVMPENGSTGQQVTIPVGKNPQMSAEKLAVTITDRVTDWGIALSGGYWKPELVVDVAADAEDQYQQLSQLLDGSGLAIRRRTASR